MLVPRGRHRLALVLAAACWGSTGTLIKIASKGLSPVTLLITELLAANVVLWGRGGRTRLHAAPAMEPPRSAQSCCQLGNCNKHPGCHYRSLRQGTHGPDGAQQQSFMHAAELMSYESWDMATSTSGIAGRSSQGSSPGRIVTKVR
jgi:hypothetical protein